MPRKISSQCNFKLFWKLLTNSLAYIFMKKICFMGVVVLASTLPLYGFSNPISQEVGPTPNSTLRITIEGKRILGEADLHSMKFSNFEVGQKIFEKNIVRIGPKETIQLKIELIQGRNVAKDITQDVSTTYESLSPWKLSVSPSGLVSSLDEGLQSKAGDTSIFITYNTPTSQGWNKVFLKNQ